MTTGERTRLQEWAYASLLGQPTSSDGDSALLPVSPVSFVLDGRPSSAFIDTWQSTVSGPIMNDGSEAWRAVMTDPATGLQVSSDVTIHTGHAAVEWVTFVKNCGSRDSSMIEHLRPLDLGIAVPPEPPLELGSSEPRVALYFSHGSLFTEHDFVPIERLLTSRTVVDLPEGEGESAFMRRSGRPPHHLPFPSLDFFHLLSRGHVPSQLFLPYFNLAWQGGGIAGAIGWTGQWRLRVVREHPSLVRLEASQQDLRTFLRPGEQIRTPRILLVRWEGEDRIRGNNLLRRVLIDRYVPRRDGEMVVPPIAGSSALTYDLNGISEQNQLATIEMIAPLGIETMWVDAGWFEGGWPRGVGSWVPDQVKFPNGLRPIGQAAHAAGLKFLLWFEPERVTIASRIALEHPDWVLHAPHTGKTDDYEVFSDDDGLLNLADPDAVDWLTEHISACITEWGIDYYRHDRNQYPLSFWRAADQPDRMGITENRYVEGFYRFLDELLRRHPTLVIDNANWRVTGPDLEMLCRSAGSFTRSETGAEGFSSPTYDQAQTAGLSQWIPVHSNIVYPANDYVTRSAAMNGFVFLTVSPEDPTAFSLEDARRAVAEVRLLRPFYTGDFYPLVDISTDESAWCAWQFHREDLGAGFAVFFRRGTSPYRSAQFNLRGLEVSRRYEISDGGARDRMVSGLELSPVTVDIETPLSSRLLIYRQAPTTH